jgi:hypothetical protein
VAEYAATFETFPGDGEGKRAAEEAQAAAAKILTDNGHGSTMYAQLEKKAGDWQVNIYRR